MSDPLATLAFASCARVQVRKTQIAWREIAQSRPDLLLMLGDNVYANQKRWDIDELARRYDEQWAVPNFRTALETLDYLATWDDHDIGPDNAKGDTDAARAMGKTGLERREEARELFLSYLRPKVSAPANLQTVAGEIYCSYVLNGVLIIVLDGRYYRQAATTPDAQVLGDRQTAWLWDRLELARTGGFAATVICCGSTINANKGRGESVAHYDRFYAEFKARFIRCPNPIFLSGDVHRNQITKHDGFLEATSSGVARIGKTTLLGALRNGIELLNNWGQLSIYDDQAVLKFNGNDDMTYVFPYPLGVWA